MANFSSFCFYALIFLCPQVSQKLFNILSYMFHYSIISYIILLLVSRYLGYMLYSYQQGYTDPHLIIQLTLYIHAFTPNNTIDFVYPFQKRFLSNFPSKKFQLYFIINLIKELNWIFCLISLSIN